MGRTFTVIEIFYLMDTPFCFGPVKIAEFQTVKDILTECLTLIGIKLMQICTRDEFIAVIGTLSSLSYYAILAVSPSSYFLYIGKLEILLLL